VDLLGFLEQLYLPLARQIILRRKFKLHSVEVV
jgi:hypothetical protein